MQIHELNNYSGELNNGAYTIIDNGSDTGKISVPDLLEDVTNDITALDTRVDNLISGLTVDSEVIDARVGVNGNVYPTLGKAIRGQISGIDEILETDIVDYGVVMTPSDTITGAYFLDTGKYINTVGSQYIVKQYPVYKGLTYNFYGTVSLQVQAGLIAFDTDDALENNQMLSSVIKTQGPTATAVDQDYTASENGYIYIASVTGRGELQVTQKTKYDSARLDTIETVTSGIENSTVVKEIETSNEVIPGLYISAGGVLTSISDSVNFRVYYIPVKSGETVRVTYNNYTLLGNYAAVIFTTSMPAAGVSGAILASGSTTAQDLDVSYTANADGYLVVANGRVSLDFHFYREISVLSNVVNKDVKIQLFGDSITDNLYGDYKTWANLIQSYMLGYNVTVYNDAVGGSGIRGHGKSSGTTGSHQDDEYNYVWDLVTNGTTLQTDADAIVILSGTNDWSANSPLGDMSSETYSTVYGALKQILEYISEHTEAIVFVCTIPQRYNSQDQGRSTNEYGEPLNAGGISLADYCKPFEVVPAFYGMPVIPLNTALGWNRINVADFTTDGLHPNIKGDNRLAEFICAEIKKHLG